MILQNDIEDSDKQNIASEFNLSETVFVSKQWSPSKTNKDQNEFVIRWFTPTREVELCGHATMAASYVIFTQEDNRFATTINKSEPLVFETNFKTSVQTELQNGSVVLNFPKNAPEQVVEKAAWLDEIKNSLLGKEQINLIKEVQLSPNAKKLMIRLDDKVDVKVLRNIQPNFSKLVSIDNGDRVRGVIVTKKTDVQSEGVHFVSRYFAPWVGIDEDPVTGSAHTGKRGMFLAKRIYSK